MGMGREEAYAATLDAIADIQKNISLILAAKATEAEKVRNWLLQNIRAGAFETNADRLATCLQIHEQHIEVIDGLTKLCYGLSRNLRVILHPELEDGGGGGGQAPYNGGFDLEDHSR